MAAPVSEEQFVAILRKCDPKWIASVASESGKDPSILEFGDVAQAKFSKNTSFRISSSVEHQFGVCLPLNFNRRWITEECFSYLTERVKKPEVNIRLAESRIEISTTKATVQAAICILLLVGFPFLTVSFWQSFGVLGAFSALLSALFFVVMPLNWLVTQYSYMRLIRRIKRLRLQHESEC